MAKPNLMAAIKASCMSVFNHWRALETTLTSESNEWNQITYLQS